MLKIIFSLLLLYFIFSKIDIGEVLAILKTANPYYFLAALLFFIASKWMAAFRLNLYFHQVDVPLAHSSNLRLYLLGMFYNLFLPGGIGGDAYKGYLIRKNFAVRTREVVAVLVLDRLSGLLLLFVFACLLGVFSKHQVLDPLGPYFVLAALVSIGVFWLGHKRLFPYVIPIFWRSLGYSAIVQLAQLTCALFILKALYIESLWLVYLFIFLVSSIVAVLPLTIGGIGSRELVFFYGALWLGLEEHTSVGVSMAFFLITAIVSLAGIWYHFKKPGLSLTPGE